MATPNKPQSKSGDSLTVKNTQEMIRVTNDALSPHLICGDILFIEPREPTNDMVWGMPHVIILKNNDIYIRRIHHAQWGYYRLVSDNVEKYPNQFIGIEQVKSVKAIIKVVRYITERIEFIQP